jgi:hypothetical protein
MHDTWRNLLAEIYVTLSALYIVIYDIRAYISLCLLLTNILVF